MSVDPRRMLKAAGDLVEQLSSVMGFRLVPVSNEWIVELEGGWSGPVHLRARRTADGSYELLVMKVAPTANSEAKSLRTSTPG